MSQSYVLHKGDPNRELVLANLDSFLNRLPDTKSWQVEVFEYHKPSSEKQRRSLFGVAYKVIMAATGLHGEKEKAQLHRDFCCDFFGTRMVLGKPHPIRTTTTNERGERDKINTVTALELYAHIQRTVAGFGIDVPDPDPFWREKAAQELAAMERAA